MNSKLLFGIDIGGTNTKIGLIQNDGNIIAHTTFPTNDPVDFPQFISRLVSELKKLKPDFEQTIKAIGIGAPNANSENGKLESPPNLKWGTVDVKGELKKYTQVPIYLENDANVCAIGEKVWGGAKDSNDFIVVTLGTGIGTGIYSNGTLLKGSNKMAAEGGHITIVPDGRPCNCGGFGHLECYASVRGIKETTRLVLNKDLSFKEIFELYKNNDPKMEEIFDQTAKYLALGISDMVVLLGPTKVFLAGGIATVGDKFSQLVDKYLQDYLFVTLKNSCSVETSKIATTHGAILGSAALGNL